MPKYTFLQRAYVTVIVDSPDPVAAEKKFAKWADRHRNQKFGRDGLCVMMPGPHGTIALLDEHHEHIALSRQQTLRRTS